MHRGTFISPLPFQKLTWRSRQEDRETCAMKGKHRVREALSSTHLKSRNRSPKRKRNVNPYLSLSLSLSLSLPHPLFLRKDECHNFIKVLAPRNDDLVFICGTNGFNPMCRFYRVSPRPPLLLGLTASVLFARAQRTSFRRF